MSSIIKVTLLNMILVTMFISMIGMGGCNNEQAYELGSIVEEKRESMEIVKRSNEIMFELSEQYFKDKISFSPSCLNAEIYLASGNFVNTKWKENRKLRNRALGIAAMASEKYKKLNLESINFSLNPFKYLQKNNTPAVVNVAETIKDDIMDIIEKDTDKDSDIGVWIIDQLWSPFTDNYSLDYNICAGLSTPAYSSTGLSHFPRFRLSWKDHIDKGKPKRVRASESTKVGAARIKNSTYPNAFVLYFKKDKKKNFFHELDGKPVSPGKCPFSELRKRLAEKNNSVKKTK